MKVANAVAEILKREGIEFLIGYPVNPIIEAAAEADIRTIMVRQERIGLHMCDAIAKVTSGDRIGVFAMQHGPGTENAFGGVAQSYGDSCPVVVLPAGYARNVNQVRPNFNAALNFRHVTKWIEQVTVPGATEEAMRRAFTQVKNGRPAPVLIEFPSDLLREEISGPIEYQKTPRLKSGPDPRSVSEIAAALVEAQRPVIVAGQGVHYGEGMEAVAATRGIARGAGHDDLAGQERLSREPPAGPRLGRDRDLEAVAHLPAERRSGVRHRLQLHPLQLCDADAEGHAHRPCDARPDRHQQGRAGRARSGRRCRADPRRAARRSEGPAARQATRPARRGDPRHQLAEEGVDGAVDAAADPEHDAAVALSGDLGIAAHGRRQGDDHYP